MKVLLVTTNNYPNEGTCTNIYNNLLYIGDLIGTGNEFHVLASKQNYYDNDFEENRSVKIHRVFSWTLLDRKPCIRALKHYLSIKGICIRYLYHLQNKYCKSHFIDYATMRAFFKSLKKMSALDFDVIITISGRYDASYAVMKYCSKYKKPYILYQVDPCATNKVYNTDSVNNREKLEVKLYEHAKYIFTTPIILDEHRNGTFSRFTNKVAALEFPVVVPNVISVSNNGKKRVMFLGSFYKNVRSPDYMFEIFEDLLKSDSIVLELVGVTSEILNESKKKLPIKCHGKKSIAECKKLMQEADILINIGNRINNQVPSKIFEYISTGKPIINICAVEDCPTLKYLDKYPLALNIVEDKSIINEQKKRLKEFIFSSFENLSEDWITKQYMECTPKYVAMKILNAINKN